MVILDLTLTTSFKVITKLLSFFPFPGLKNVKYVLELEITLKVMVKVKFKCKVINFLLLLKICQLFYNSEMESLGQF